MSLAATSADDFCQPGMYELELAGPVADGSAAATVVQSRIIQHAADARTLVMDRQNLGGVRIGP